MFCTSMNVRRRLPKGQVPPTRFARGLRAGVGGLVNRLCRGLERTPVLEQGQNPCF